jgi:hypothetical protein
MATRTITIDTASSPWVYSDGYATTISGTSEDFTLTFDDKGTGGPYYGVGGNNSLALANGDVLKISADPAKTFFYLDANSTATPNVGSLWANINDGQWEEVKIVSITMADSDGTGANNLTAITFEYPGLPYRWSWANINMA